jgi:ribosomal protein S18 acetylase RimI-like enzyme
MTAELVIRPAEASDLPAVRALLVETWHDTYDDLIGAAKVTEITDSWHSLDNLARQLGNVSAAFLVAVEGERVVGHILAGAPKPPTFTVWRLYVLPARQRQGIGRRLLDAAVKRFPDAGILRLKVEADNAKGLAFYRREGFRQIAEETVEGIRHYEMEKQL